MSNIHRNLVKIILYYDKWKIKFVLCYNSVAYCAMSLYYDKQKLKFVLCDNCPGSCTMSLYYDKNNLLVIVPKRLCTMRKT